MMQRQIEIYEQDAYRAKTENCFRSGIFFEDVYKRTDAIVCDIIEQMQIYTEDSKKQGGHKPKYHGMGNNIVAFCAGRGQGKTSAMQSYAAYLQKKDIAEENFFEKNNVIDRSQFKVLDPIDISSLDSGESIIRVLVSRLFLEFSKIVEKDEISFRDEIQFRKRKDAILKAFQRCYENIDYLNKGRNIEIYDLETLAQLGNSAELKKNLYDLVDYYLNLLFEKEKGAAYLVLQIDDADLFMGDIFKICDDIRNYFSIPNMIVMMATEYTQLEWAICQRYIKQYEHMIQLQGREDYLKKCNTMAFRYLEKMLPAGHRVVLPTVDVLINENANSLRVSYYGNRNNADVLKADCKCWNMQQQLIKFLYIKTGIILLERSGEMHPILPHTLRELTHFIKLLDSMESIEWQEAFKVRAGSGNPVEVEKWKNNLDILKRYFLHYWCGTHLSYKQQKLIEDMDQAQRRMDSVSHYIMNYIGDNHENEPIPSTTYKNVMRLLVEERLKGESELQNAIFFYYSIVLNEWFARGLEDTAQLKTMAGFVEEPLDVEISSENEGKYNILQFEFSIEKIRQYAAEELTNVLNNAWLMTFCTGTPDVLDILAVESIQTGKNLNLRFNLFHPLLSMLYSDMWVNKDIGRQEEETEASVNDDINLEDKPNMSTDMSYLISVKNLITNYDVQNLVRIKVQNKIDELESESGERRLDRIWKGVYESIDSWVDEAVYLKEKSNLTELCFGDNLANPVMGNVVFMSNDSNREKYVGEYKDYLAEEVKTINEKIVEIGKKSDNEAVELAVKQMQGELKFNSFRSKVVLSMEDKKTSSQFLQKISGLKELIEIEQQMEQKMEEECSRLISAVEAGEKRESLRMKLNSLKNQIKKYKEQICNTKIS